VFMLFGTFTRSMKKLYFSIVQLTKNEINKL
jgi:hypothetical protein